MWAVARCTFRARLFGLSAPSILILAMAATTTAQSQPKHSSIKDHFRRGDELLSKKDWDGAIAEYREALRLDPKNDEGHVKLGQVLGKKGDWDGAVAEEREALRRHPPKPGQQMGPPIPGRGARTEGRLGRSNRRRTPGAPPEPEQQRGASGPRLGA